MDHNPNLQPWRRAEPNQLAGKGHIESPNGDPNIVWQTRPCPLSVYEDTLADALIACFDTGIEELSELVAALNSRGVLGPDGSAWTPETFEREMARLGA